LLKKPRMSSVAIALSSVALLASAHPVTAQDPGATAGAQVFKGIVAPAHSYAIAAPFDGQITTIHFVAGQYVEKGVLLFTFDTTKEELELERDQARLLRTEAQLRMAELVLKSNTELRKKNVISERQFAESEAQRDIAMAAVVEARVQVRSDMLRIKEMKRYAPFSGIMNRPMVIEGAFVKQALEMAMITELDPVQVRASVPYELYTKHLKLLKFESKVLDPREATRRIEVLVTLPNGEQLPQVGRISGGGYEFDPKTQVMEVMVDFPNPGLLLRPGLAVTLQARVNPD